jgi:light-regulated signal transduction histidine kinase (bacteriophytochrome)
MTDASHPRIEALEREVAQLKEECAAARRELESFTYAVSHDLRAPLRSLSGFSQALAELPADTVDPKARHYLDRIQQASRKMSELIDALLALSRLSQADLQFRAIDLTQVCTEACTAVRNRYPMHSMDVHIAQQMTAFGDSRSLRTAIEALLDNAFKFTQHLERPEVRIALTPSEPGPAMTIADNGVGFDMSYADKLFRPFQRLHANAQLPGLGVGLAGVQRIVARHHGHIWAQAAPEKGATFFLYLPAGGAKTASQA